MSEASNHDCAVLLRQDIAELAGVAAHYMRMVSDYAFLGNDTGTRYAMKCGVLHVKAAVRSMNDLEKLIAPASSENEGVAA